MPERRNIITAMELRTLEIDLENNVLRLNGDDLKQFKELSVQIDIKSNEYEITVKTDLWTSFYSSQRRKRRGSTEIKS